MSDPVAVDSEGVISFKDNRDTHERDDDASTSDDGVHGHLQTTNSADSTTLRRHGEQIQGMKDMMTTMSGAIRDVATALHSIQPSASHRAMGARDMSTEGIDANDNHYHRRINYTAPSSHHDCSTGTTDRHSGFNAQYLHGADAEGQGVHVRGRFSDHSLPPGRQQHRTDGRPEGYYQTNRDQRQSPNYNRGSKYANVKIPSFDGKDDWCMWIARFEAIAYRYQWSEEDRLDQLLPRIEGTAAQFVFSQLPAAVLCNYRELVAEINSRFRVVETARSFAAKFSRRSQRHGETAEEYAADLKMLYDKAHGFRDRHTRDEDLVRRFLDGLLDEDVRFEVEFHKEPQNIDEAVYQAVNLVQIRNSCRGERRQRNMTRRAQASPDEQVAMYYDGSEEPERAYAVNDGPGSRTAEPQRKERSWKPREKEPDSMGKLMEMVIARLDKLEGRRRPRNKEEVECYNCHKLGHYARECPERLPDEQRRKETEQAGAQVPAVGRHLNYKGPALAARGGSQ